MRAAVVIASFAAVWVQQAHSQSFPQKPIRLVVPAAPGGNTDIIARVLAPRMSEHLGQSIVIENRGGAGNTIGTHVVGRAPPDGYTMLMVSAGHTINPAMVKKLPYDSLKDFAPISLIAEVPSALVVHPSLPVINAKELITLARQRPGALNYSTPGRGSVGHLAAELLSANANVKLVHVPYKGAGPALIDLVAGQVELQFASIPAVVQYVQNKRLRMIAQTGAQRSRAAQQVPTMVESGLPGFVVSSGFGLLAPGGTPRPIVERLNAAARAAVSNPDVARTLAEQGAEPVGSTPEDYEQFNRIEIAKWIKVTREAGIQPE
jgi:tripartite-type tricarboxylate transporter receptor subunit TctC